MVTWWVCQLLYIIIFVPYNLFKLFLVHKISVYKYICENGKKNWKKEKEKEFSASWVRGDFGPVSEGARAGAGRWPSRPMEERRSTGGHRGRGLTRQREEGVTVWSGRRREGANRSARPPVRSTTVLRREPGFATEECWRGTGGGRGSWR
jgi:hypothetical protein